jgi:hypothetical protein
MLRGFFAVSDAGVVRRMVVPFPGFVSMIAALLYGIVLMMPVQVARAQTPGGGNPNIAQLISRITSSKIAELGFSDAEQSVIAATYNAMSGVAAEAGEAAGAAVLGPWLAVLAALAAMAPTELGDDTLTTWQLNHNGSVIVGVKGSGGVIGGHWQYYEVWLKSQPVTVSSQYVIVDFANLADAAAAFAKNQSDWNDAEFNTYSSSQAPGTYPDVHVTFAGTCDDSTSNVVCYFNGHDTKGVVADTANSRTAFATGMNGTPASLDPGGEYQPGTSMSVADAIAAIPQADLAKPVSPDVMAALVNGLWQQAAAQPGYQGIPYPASDPVTAADVAPIETATTTGWPTVGTLAAPVTAPTGGGNPYAIPVGTGSPTGGTDPASSPSGTSPPDTTALCTEFPSIIACQSPGSATAPDLASSSGSVSVTPVTVGSSDGVCPAPVSVSVLGMDLSFSYQAECDFMSRARPFVLAMCGIIAALVFGAGLKS